SPRTGASNRWHIRMTGFSSITEGERQRGDAAAIVQVFVCAGALVGVAKIQRRMIRERPAQGHRRGLRRARPSQAVSEKVVAESRIGGNRLRLEKDLPVPPGGRHDIA